MKTKSVKKEINNHPSIYGQPMWIKAMPIILMVIEIDKVQQSAFRSTAGGGNYKSARFDDFIQKQKKGV